MTAAGGLPGELNINWLSKSVASFDCEYGFSCMGYETAGAWGAAFARTEGEVLCLVGDGSYLMLNSEIYSSVLSGKKFILIVCDNAGFAVIERLQRNQGGNSYNNMLRDARGPHSDVRVDFVAHAASLGAYATRASSIAELESGDREGPRPRPDQRHRRRRPRVRLDRGRPLLAGRGPRGERAGVGPRGPRRARGRAWRTSDAASDVDGEHRARAGRRPAPAHPTIRDVAARAGVSKSLVSLALQNAPRVAPETREAILAAAEEIGYRRNAAAHALVARRTRTIGVFVLDLHNPMTADVLDAVQAEARRRDYRTIVVVGGEDAVAERAELEKLLEFRVEGIIALGHRLPARGRGGGRRGLPGRHHRQRAPRGRPPGLDEHRRRDGGRARRRPPRRARARAHRPRRRWVRASSRATGVAATGPR